MQGSYFHHLFLLCIWLLVKAPQLGCDAVSISGQQDRAAANQCQQNCSLAAKAFESPETCYKECLKKIGKRQFAGNEQSTALSRRIKRDSTQIPDKQEHDCVKFRDTYGYLPRKYINVTLEYLPVAIGQSSYNVSISWNVSSGLTSNWTQGYRVSYILRISTTKKKSAICLRLLGMNTSFFSFNIKDKDLNPDSSKIYVMVNSLSHKGPRKGSKEQFAIFSNESLTSRVRTGKECDDFAETKDFIPKKNIRIELILTTSGYYNTRISWELESGWRYMIVYKLDGLVNDTRTPIFCRAVKKGNSIRLGRLDVPNKLLLANRSRILVAVTSLSKKSNGTERVRNGSQYQIANFSDAIIPSTLPTEIVSTSPNVTIDPTKIVSTSPNVTIDPTKGTERKTLPTAAVVAMCVTVAFGFVVVAVVIWWRFGGKKTKEEDVVLLDSGFEFDAFIIYSTTDEEWVNNKLLSTLETKHNIKCCIHYRDFPPGVPFLDNMVESINNSRKTIAVVSKSFLGSSHCNNELNMALHRLAKRRDNSVIVIKLDDVGNSDLPKQLQSRSYIDFTKATDKKTWEDRLVRSLRGERC